MTASPHVKGYSSRQFALTSTVREIVGPSDRRYAVIIPPPVRGTAYLGGDNTVTIGNGIPLKSTDPPLVLTIDIAGDLVRRGIWAVGAAYMSDVETSPLLQKTSYVNQAAPGTASTNIAPAAGNHIRVAELNCSVNANEPFLWEIHGSGGVTVAYGWGVGGIGRNFIPQLRIPTSETAIVTATQSATSTFAIANIIGYEYSGVSTINTTVNLSVIEVFSCECKDDIAGILSNLRG